MATSPSEPKKSKSKKPDPIGFKVHFEGSQITLYPASASDEVRLKRGRYKEGDLIFGVIRKPRNPGFHRLMHRIGKLVSENIDAFDGMDPHLVIKRLQYESGVGCETISVPAAPVFSQLSAWVSKHLGKHAGEILKIFFRDIGTEMINVKAPISISYGSMDQIEFHGVVKGLCDYIHKTYWQDIPPEKIEEMAESMVDD